MKIQFFGSAPVSDERLAHNVKHAHLSGLPFVLPELVHFRRLAIVGGGPSIVDKIEELRNFAGDIWAINGACHFLQKHGIESTLFSIDPLGMVAGFASGIENALLCTRCDPQVLASVKNVRLFDLHQDNAQGIHASTSTATTAFHLAIELGYRQLVFYGCEGCFTWDATHAYYTQSDGLEFTVECGGVEYLTRPDLYVQTCHMAEMLRKFPSHFHERSGGLLRAMIQNPEHDIVSATQAIHDQLTKTPEQSECFS